MKSLIDLFENFKAEQVATLMSNSFAARLGKPKVIDSFNALFETYSVEQIVDLMSDSFAPRLEEV